MKNIKGEIREALYITLGRRVADDVNRGASGVIGMNVCMAYPDSNRRNTSIISCYDGFELYEYFIHMRNRGWTRTSATFNGFGLKKEMDDMMEFVITGRRINRATFTTGSRRGVTIFRG